MSVKIRLSRTGRHFNPTYRVVLLVIPIIVVICGVVVFIRRRNRWKKISKPFWRALPH